jgi:hypothetical protein
VIWRKLERVIGFEPTTSCLANNRSALIISEKMRTFLPIRVTADDPCKHRVCAPPGQPYRPRSEKAQCVHLPKRPQFSSSCPSSRAIAAAAVRCTSSEPCGQVDDIRTIAYEIIGD